MAGDSSHARARRPSEAAAVHRGSLLLACSAAVFSETRGCLGRLPLPRRRSGEFWTVKTRTTRRRPVTVKLGEQSLEIQAPGFKAIRRGAEKHFYWIKDDHAEFALYEPKTVRIYVDGLD